jgi:all-trans-retinol 13,14-reductase
MKEQYDVAFIVGSGLGGLTVSSHKEGYSVCSARKKQNQFAGNLQTFVREINHFRYWNTLYLWVEGQNLYKYFKYLGIMDDLKLKKNGRRWFDIISFEDTQRRISMRGSSYENFIKLVHFFPGRATSHRKLLRACKPFAICSYNSRMEGKYDSDILSLNAKQCIDEATDNEKN